MVQQQSDASSTAGAETHRSTASSWNQRYERRALKWDKVREMTKKIAAERAKDQNAVHAKPNITKTAQNLERSGSAFDLLYDAAKRTNEMRNKIHEERDSNAVQGPAITEKAKAIQGSFLDRLAATEMSRIKSRQQLVENLSAGGRTDEEHLSFAPMITRRAAGVRRSASVEEYSEEWVKKREKRRQQLAEQAHAEEMAEVQNKPKVSKKSEMIIKQKRRAMQSNILSSPSQHANTFAMVSTPQAGGNVGTPSEHASPVAVDTLYQSEESLSPASGRLNPGQRLYAEGKMYQKRKEFHIEQIREAAKQQSERDVPSITVKSGEILGRNGTSGLEASHRLYEESKIRHIRREEEKLKWELESQMYLELTKAKHQNDTLWQTNRSQDSFTLQSPLIHQGGHLTPDMADYSLPIEDRLMQRADEKEKKRQEVGAALRLFEMMDATPEVNDTSRRINESIEEKTGILTHDRFRLPISKVPRSQRGVRASMSAGDIGEVTIESGQADQSIRANHSVNDLGSLDASACTFSPEVNSLSKELDEEKNGKTKGVMSRRKMLLKWAKKREENLEKKRQQELDDIREENNGFTPQHPESSFLRQSGEKPILQLNVNKFLKRKLEWAEQRQQKLVQKKKEIEDADREFAFAPQRPKEDAEPAVLKARKKIQRQENVKRSVSAPTTPRREDEYRHPSVHTPRLGSIGNERWQRTTWSAINKCHDGVGVESAKQKNVLLGLKQSVDLKFAYLKSENDRPSIKQQSWETTLRGGERSHERKKAGLSSVSNPSTPRGTPSSLRRSTSAGRQNEISSIHSSPQGLQKSSVTPSSSSASAKDWNRRRSIALTKQNAKRQSLAVAAAQHEEMASPSLSQNSQSSRSLVSPKLAQPEARIGDHMVPEHEPSMKQSDTNSSAQSTSLKVPKLPLGKLESKLQEASDSPPMAARGNRSSENLQRAVDEESSDSETDDDYSMDEFNVLKHPIRSSGQTNPMSDQPRQPILPQPVLDDEDNTDSEDLGWAASSSSGARR